MATQYQLKSVGGQAVAHLSGFLIGSKGKAVDTKRSNKLATMPACVQVDLVWFTRAVGRAPLRL